MWPADDGANGLDPCKPSPDVYPNDMISFLIHGPFDLTGASEAWVDFNFRNMSEPSYDFFCWGASVNGYQFYGPACNSGAYIFGPHRNGYNLMRFNLANVNTLGDLRGAPDVWLAFIFASDYSYGYQGPFLDDVRVAVERPGASPGGGSGASWRVGNLYRL